MSKVQEYENDLQEAAAICKALSHPARLAILRYLSKINVCMSGDISDELPLSRTTVHQHLAELKKLDLIKGQIEGVKTNYCLNQEKLKHVQDILNGFMGELYSCSNNNC